MAKDKTSMKQKVEKEKSLLYVLIGSHRNKEYSCVAWLPSLVFLLSSPFPLMWYYGVSVHQNFIEKTELEHGGTKRLDCSWALTIHPFAYGISQHHQAGAFSLFIVSKQENTVTLCSQVDYSKQRLTFVFSITCPLTKSY